MPEHEFQYMPKKFVKPLFHYEVDSQEHRAQDERFRAQMAQLAGMAATPAQEPEEPASAASGRDAAVAAASYSSVSAVSGRDAAAGAASSSVYGAAIDVVDPDVEEESWTPRREPHEVAPAATEMRKMTS